jgi:hypothetical protein
MLTRWLSSRFVAVLFAGVLAAGWASAQLVSGDCTAVASGPYIGSICHWNVCEGTMPCLADYCDPAGQTEICVTCCYC